MASRERFLHNSRMQIDNYDDEEIDVEGDYEDDYDDDDVEFHYKGGSSSGPETDGDVMSRLIRNVTGMVEARKEHHNKLERKRRLSIKCSFNQLKENVPSLKGEKASRAYILQKAVEHIEDIKSKSRMHATDVERLTRQNRQLEKEILEYERILLQIESVHRQKTGKLNSDGESVLSTRQSEVRESASEATSGSSIADEPLQKKTRSQEGFMKPPPAPSESKQVITPRFRSVSVTESGRQPSVRLQGSVVIRKNGASSMSALAPFAIRTKMVVRPSSSSESTKVSESVQFKTSSTTSMH